MILHTKVSTVFNFSNLMLLLMQNSQSFDQNSASLSKQTDGSGNYGILVGIIDT